MVKRKCAVGLDLSMTRTGMAMAYDDGTPPAVGTVESRGKKDESWGDRDIRIDFIVSNIRTWAEMHRRGVLTGIYIEGPSYGSTTGHQHDRSGLWWRVYHELRTLAPVYVIQPQTRAKYATGAGTAGKDKVLAATVRQFLDVDVWCNDIADALQLVAMGARDQCWPIDSDKPRAALDALEKISE